MVRAPDHLGDGVMALPAMNALRAVGSVRVVGPSWATPLYGSPDHDDSDEDAAILFKPSFSAAWQARHHPRRVGLSTDGRWPLLTDAVVPQGRHRSRDFEAIAAVVGATTAGLPTLQPNDSDLPMLPDDFVVFVPLTRSPKTMAWTGFAALAEAIGRDRVVFAAGPGEDSLLARVANGCQTLPPLPIEAFAAVAARARAIVGNDSGLTHLATAAVRGAGRDTRCVHVIYGSTDPTRTGPQGTTTHHGLRPTCWPCYAKTCTKSRPAACLDASVASIAQAVSTSS